MSSDTTAFIAGCATTGVAVLVLLVSRAGGPATVDSVTSPPERAAVEATAVPVPQVPTPDYSDELRRELERQREITSRLENQ
ncbi:MAG: hypothetical protein F6J97_15120, partial [Leptolyngbya sp. SIO4C1]|nr:hypothetical protein [Leptolyngbya sp. SIO4C1]